jgi:hypothetical protein
VNGFNDKLLPFTHELLVKFLEFGKCEGFLPEWCEEKRFGELLEEVKRFYGNACITVSSYVTDLRIRCLRRSQWSSAQKLTAISSEEEPFDLSSFSMEAKRMLACITSSSSSSSSKRGEREGGGAGDNWPTLVAFYHGNCDQGDAALATDLLSKAAFGDNEEEEVNEEEEKITTDDSKLQPEKEEEEQQTVALEEEKKKKKSSSSSSRKKKKNNNGKSVRAASSSSSGSQEILDTTATTTGHHQAEAVVKIPIGTTVILSRARETKETNNAVELYTQIGADDLRMRVILDVLEQIMSEPMFDKLRTKEQFGYSVSCGARWTNGVMGYILKIVSSVKTSDEITKRLNEFLLEFREETLVKMKEDEFLENVIGLAKIKLQSFDSLEAECSHYWSEVVERRFSYDVSREEVCILQGIKKDDVLKVFDDFFLDDSKKRVLIVKIVKGVEMREQDEEVETRGMSALDGCEKWPRVYE